MSGDQDIFRERQAQAAIPRKWLLWVGLALACAIFALGNAFSWYQYSSRRAGSYGPNWNQALGWELLRWFLWLPLGMLILLAERWLERRAKTFHQILWGAAAILGVALLHTVLLVALYFPFSAASVTAFFRYRFFVLAIDWLTGIVVCGLVAGFAKARSYYLRLREEELKTAEMQAQIARAELEALKMQLHPHFLFNTLNAISALQSDEPEMAQLALARLADFLRLTLENAGIQEVILDRELDFVMRYLEIEKLRFGKKLTVRMEIDPTTRGARVPNLILQPLVENAIRHGIGAKAAPGRIEISSSKSNGTLFLCVRDTGPGMAASPREGIGLGNTRARLDRLYGSASCLRLKNAAEGGLEASIEMPLMVDERGSREDEDEE